MTAGQVAGKAGLARNTVSATLSKLARSGEIEKADRGYRLAGGGHPGAATSEPPAVTDSQSTDAAGEAAAATAPIATAE